MKNNAQIIADKIKNLVDQLAALYAAIQAKITSTK